MSTTIKYKGSVLAEVSNETKTLNTAGTWLEDDIEVMDASSGGGGGLIYQDEEGYIVLGENESTVGQYTARIVGSGHYSNCYTELVGTDRYYTDGDVFTFSNGDSLRFVLAYANCYLYLNGEALAVSTSSSGGSGIDKTISNISYDIIITIDSASTFKTINIDARSKLAISQNGTYDLDGYDVADVNIAGADDIITRRISGYYENSTVTYVGQYAFMGCSLLTEVSFPKALSIQPYAFASCSALTSVCSPSVSMIGSNAFENCIKLEAIPNSTITHIGKSAFASCGSITEATFAASMISCEDYAFTNCSNLSRIIIASDCTHVQLGSYAFASCYALEEISAPELKTLSANPYTFTYCSTISQLSFPMLSQLTGSNCFAYCFNLISLNFPLLSAIPDGAFRSCSALTDINMPALTRIGDSAFSGCRSLVSISQSMVSYVGVGAFSGCWALADVSLPSLGSVVDGAFRACRSLSSIYFPRVSYVGSYAFGGCSSLNTVIIGNSTSFSSGWIGLNAFISCYNLLSLYLLTPFRLILSGTNAFTSTPISTYTTSTGGVYGSIFVPESLYSVYISTMYWTTYSSRFVSMTDAEIEELISSIE